MRQVVSPGLPVKSVILPTYVSNTADAGSVPSFNNFGGDNWLCAFPVVPASVAQPGTSP